MKVMKKFTIALVLIAFAFAGNAQILTPVKWSYASKRLSPTEGVVFMKATIEEGWHVYSQSGKAGGPVRTSFTYKTGKGYKISGSTAEPTPITKFEKVFNMPVSYFANSVIFQQKIRLTSKGPVTVKGALNYMTCNDEKCLPPEEIEFAVVIKSPNGIETH